MIAFWATLGSLGPLYESVKDIDNALLRGGKIRNNEKRYVKIAQYDENQKELPKLAAKVTESLNANNFFNRPHNDGKTVGEHDNNQGVIASREFQDQEPSAPFMPQM